MRPTWERRSEVVTLMSAAGPAAHATEGGGQSTACGALGGRGAAARREPSERRKFLAAPRDWWCAAAWTVLRRGDRVGGRTEGLRHVDDVGGLAALARKGPKCNTTKRSTTMEHPERGGARTSIRGKGRKEPRPTTCTGTSLQFRLNFRRSAPRSLQGQDPRLVAGRAGLETGGRFSGVRGLR